MKALYDYAHKREIAQAEKIKNLQNLFCVKCRVKNVPNKRENPS